MVGNLHRPDCSRSTEYFRRTIHFCRDPLSSGSRRSGDLSLRQPFRCPLDSDFRTRRRQWLDLRRGGSGRWPNAADDHLHHGSYGWRASFWVCSMIGFGAGAVWFLCARDTPGEHPGVSKSELALIRSGLTKVEQSNDPTQLVSWVRVVKSREVWAITVSYFCYGYVAWIFFSWFYRYLARVRGLDLKASAFYTMLPFLAMLVCCL